MKRAVHEDAMDHAIIDENHIAERYVQGRLPPEEAQLFAEHFLGCAECLERVELAEQLQAGLQRAAVRRAAAAAAVGAGLAAWRTRRARRLLFSLGLLLAAGLPTAVLLPRVLRLDRELGEARAVKPVPEPRREEAAAPPAAESRRLTEELAAARRAADRLGEELEKARAPQVNVPILALSLVRSGPGEDEPAPRWSLPADAPWAVLSLEPSDPGFPTYQATLRTSGGRVRWQGGGLVLSPAGLLSLTLPRTLLPPGGYTLAVEGRPAGGAPVPTGTFSFAIVR